LGATEAIYSSVQALVGSGEEAIIFDPAYDSYEIAIQLAGAHCVHVPLEPPHFRYDWDRVRAAITPRTRLIIINSPLNPGCTCVTADDMLALAQLLRGRDIRVISDEVYEHIVFDGLEHHSVLKFPELRERSVAVYSFGKTLHATGLRVGYAVAPPAITTELRKVHQFNTFTIATALQQAIAGYLQEKPLCGESLGPFFTAKRALLGERLQGSGLTLPRAEGTFFQLIDYGAHASAGDLEFAEQLLTQARVATIPLSVFYEKPPPMTLLRLCIAKRDETLIDGAARLTNYLRQGAVA
jgi:methionine transaminase